MLSLERATHSVCLYWISLDFSLYTRCEETMKISMLARAVGGCVALHSAQGFVAGSAIGRVSSVRLREKSLWVLARALLSLTNLDHRAQPAQPSPPRSDSKSCVSMSCGLGGLLRFAAMLHPSTCTSAQATCALSHECWRVATCEGTGVDGGRIWIIARCARCSRGRSVGVALLCQRALNAYIHEGKIGFSIDVLTEKLKYDTRINTRCSSDPTLKTRPPRERLLLVL